MLPKPKRMAFEAAPRVVDDVRAITERTGGTATAALAAAVRCFRACLENGLAAESGELFQSHPVSTPAHQNGKPDGA